MTQDCHQDEPIPQFPVSGEKLNVVKQFTYLGSILTDETINAKQCSA